MTPDVVKPLRLGVVSYLNAAPMVHGLDGDPRYQIRRGVPARVAEELRRGEVDLGMIPSVEYRSGEYAIVPGIGIAGRGAVRSVRLFHRGPLESVSIVAVDEASRTSFALLRILLKARLGREPEYEPMRKSVAAMLDTAGAAMAIGDASLFFDGECESLDLGAEWTALTGLPFVYAFWAGRPGAVQAADVARLRQALAEGLEAIPAIATMYDGLGAGRAALSEAYLRENIVYRLGEEELAGLREFYRRAALIGAIPRVPELRFYDSP